jgi:Ca2+-transporting ATPase
LHLLAQSLPVYFLKETKIMPITKPTPWTAFSLGALQNRLRTDFQSGLSDEEVYARRERYGENKFETRRRPRIISAIARQLKSPLAIALVGADIATLVLHEYLDATVIFIALFINVSVGVFQEGRASRAFEKLQLSQKKYATVVRDGRKIIVPTSALVPGDIVVIGAGMYVPADLRIIEEKNLSINEATLTGEWASVQKDNVLLDESTSLAEQRNMAWMGTLVVSGYGRGVVVETGERTQVGIIARSLKTVETRPTPIQASIRKLAIFLATVVLIAIAAIFLLGVLRGEPFVDMLLLSIAIAVAVMPTGLPAAVTVVLALGMEAILRRGGLVRNLLAAETLGGTTVILTDKTGTLTEAKMKLSSCYTLSSLDESRARKKNLDNDNKTLLGMAVLASDAFVEEDPKVPEKLIVRGRPIEQAIVLAGLESGLSQEGLNADYPRIDFLQFESSQRFGASLNKIKEQKKNRLYVSGAPETLLEHASYIYQQGRVLRMTEKLKELFYDMLKREGSAGMRLIAVGYRDVSWDQIPELSGRALEKYLLDGLVFVGLLAFKDPLRAEVKKSIRIAQEAGARVIMLTGDNAETAKAIAQEAGITTRDAPLLLGNEIEQLDDSSLTRALRDTNVFARVLPQQKLRISHVLKNQGEVVAMTGDGINDAPALLSADIGVTVASGTEVAKEASDLVFPNNSFSIIVAAIEEGRRVIDNLRKIVAYLLSTSFSEVFVVGGALIIGGPIPLLPVQILWTNIIEEGFMNFAFAFEPKEEGIMKRNPRASRAGIVTPQIRTLVFTVGIITGIVLVALYLLLLHLGEPIDRIRTIMFVALSVDSIFFSFSMKNFHKPLWRVRFFSNTYLLLALTSSILLLFAAITLSPMRTLLSLVPLHGVEILILTGLGTFNLFTIELVKRIIFRKRNAREMENHVS